MEQKELSSILETSHISQEHGTSSNIGTKGSTENDSHGKIKDASSNNFRETAKYRDKESYQIQHHHSIGSGLFLTDEVSDLPPRYRNKVIRAVESLAARNNIPLSVNPLELVKSFSDDSKVEKNPDPLVCSPSNSLKDEKSKSHSKSPFKNNSNSGEIPYLHKHSDSSSASNISRVEKLSSFVVNPPGFPVSSHNFPKSKSHFISESHISGNYKKKIYKDPNYNRKERLVSQSDIQNDPCIVNEPIIVHPSQFDETSNLRPEIYNDHIAFYTELANVPRNRYGKSLNKYKSNFKQSSTDAVNSMQSSNFKLDKNTKYCTENTSKNMLPVFFPNLESSESIGKGNQIPTTNLEDNSFLTKFPGNSASKDSTYSLSQACDRVNSKNHISKTRSDIQSTSASTNCTVKRKISKPNDIGQRECSNIEKKSSFRNNAKNKKVKSYLDQESFHPDFESNTDITLVDSTRSLDNLSIKNIPIHKRRSDSKSSIASSYSSSKSFDAKGSEKVINKDLSNELCNDTKITENTNCSSNVSSYSHQNMKKKFVKQRPCNKNFNRSNSYFSDTSSIISDTSIKAQLPAGDNFNQSRQSRRNDNVERDDSGEGYCKKYPDRHINERREKYDQSTKPIIGKENYKKKNLDSSKEFHKEIANESLQHSNFYKGHEFNSKQNNIEKVKYFERSKQNDCQSLNSLHQVETNVSEHHKRKCIENGFFIKIEVFEETRNLEYWLNFFKSIFSWKFELERCCHFSDVLILEFERKEHALQSFQILYHQRKKMKNSEKPHIVFISTLIFRLVKPCNCKERVIKDCITSVKKHFEASLSVMNQKMTEIKSFKKNHSKRKPENDMLKTFEDSVLNFEHFKNDILRKIEDAKDKTTLIQEHKHSFIRECNAFKRCLPIYSKKSDILELVRYYSVSVIVAETGSGKSTQLVQYLQHTDVGRAGIIICTQPRKLAAISIAQFVSVQVGSPVGKIVGYDVGVERKCSDMTKIIYMTDYCLLKRYLKNKDLKGISCVIVDEAHERSLYTDLILGMLKQCLDIRPDLRVIITSATINPTIFIDYFKMPKKCVLEVPGRSYPVDVIWLREDVELGWDYVRACVHKAYEIHKENKEGDILVFLTSPSESDEAIYLFKRLLSNTSVKPELLCLHGKTDIQEQMQIFQSTKTSRKIVFATNVAESAVTIPGIKFVIDSGMNKELMFDPKMNKSYLAVNFINKSAAEQRKGRAGRTQFGVCYRMYSKRNYTENMSDNMTPEIFKTNLQKALLKIFELGIDPEKFDFIETPPERTISNSVDALKYLGAIENKNLTEFGKKISKLPLEPQLSKLVLQGIEAGIGYETIIIAALLSESGKLFLKSDDIRLADEKRKKFYQPGGDLCTYLEIYKIWNQIVGFRERFKWCIENYISSKALRAAVKTIDEIFYSLKHELGIRVFRQFNDSEFKNQYEKVLFDSFSENLCVSSGHPKLGYLSLNLPESFFIHPSSTLSCLGKDLPEFLVYNTLIETTRNFLFDITPISEKTIKLAIKTGTFKSPLHSFKCLQIPPKVMGPFGESLLIRHILGKNGSKINDLETKIKNLSITKNARIDVEVDKGIITIYSPQKCHEKASSYINEIIEQAHSEMLNEEDVAKLSGNSLHFALGAGGLITDIIMPGEYRELVFNFTQKENPCDLKNLLKNYGDLQSVYHNITKKGAQICATFKKVCDAQCAFLDLKKRKYNVSPKPYLPNVDDKTVPLYMLNISWCCRPCTGSGFVEFFSEEDKIVASGDLGWKSFSIGENVIMFTPSENSSRKLEMKNLPEIVQDSSVRAKLEEYLPKDLRIKYMKIFREANRITNTDVKDAEQKLSKLLSLYIAPKKFVIEMKYPEHEILWSAHVYFYNFKDAECTFRKLKDVNAVIDSFPLSIKQLYKSNINCKREVYNAVSSQINEVLKHKGNNVSINRIEEKSNLTLELCCNNLEELNKIKQSLGHFLQGESMDLIGISKYHFLFSDSYMEQIKKIQSSTNTFISLNKFRKVITVYGSSNDCRKAKEEIYLLASNPDYSYTRVFSLKDSHIPVGFLKSLYAKYGYDLHGLLDEFKLTVASIDKLKHTLTLKGLRNGIQKAEKTLEKLCEKLFESRGKCPKTNDIQELCAICLDPISYDFQRLEHCGHAFCRQCLLLQLESKTVPLVCVKQDCGKLIFLEDIKRIITFGGNHLRKEFCNVALQHHVSSNVGKLSYCPTPDCQMIYRLTKEGSVFKCPSCGNSTCTHCQTPYHYGMSCEMFQNCKKEEDYSLKAWIKENESERKYCPSCKAVIEKASGCNHMECLNCKVHMCWLCLQLFLTGDEVYYHMPFCPKNQ